MKGANLEKFSYKNHRMMRLPLRKKRKGGDYVEVGSTTIVLANH
jgi:hypothetical protein